jgi:polyribonucleotide nucleotidyltransferase
VINVPTDLIGRIVGMKGNTIRAFRVLYDVDIEVSDDGAIFIEGDTEEKASAAIEGISKSYPLFSDNLPANLSC